MTDLKKVLMERDGYSFEQADVIIADMSKKVFNGANPEVLLYDIGLEPDYIFDLI